MNARSGKRALSLTLAGLALLAISPVRGEIVLLPGGAVATVDPDYAYAHPSFRSLVFASPESRQMAILPPAPVFVAPPPLLWRAAASPFPVYPPAAYANGPNSPLRPSNRDINTYNLQRAHAFSQQFYDRNTVLGLGGVSPIYGGYGGYGGYLYGGLMPAYPPAAGTGGFNQPARPSNRDLNTYNLERAHRFSMDAYRRP
jgi:hypothetical protein